MKKKGECNREGWLYMEPPNCKHTRWPVGLLMLVAMVLMQMMVLVMIDYMVLIKIFKVSFLGIVLLWQFFLSQYSWAALLI